MIVIRCGFILFRPALDLGFTGVSGGFGIGIGSEGLGFSILYIINIIIII